MSPFLFPRQVPILQGNDVVLRAERASPPASVPRIALTGGVSLLFLGISPSSKRIAKATRGPLVVHSSVAKDDLCADLRNT